MLRLADAADVFDHFPHAVMKALSTPQLKACPDDIHGRLQGDIHGHQVFFRLRDQDLRVRTESEISLLISHRHETGLDVKRIPGHVDAVLNRLLQDCAPIAYILKVQVLWDIAGIFTVRNKLRFLCTAHVNPSGGKRQGIQIAVIACHNADRPASAFRQLLNGQNTGHRIKMINKTFPVHSCIL